MTTTLAVKQKMKTEEEKLFKEVKDLESDKER
jgi:hypothetical protein